MGSQAAGITIIASAIAASVPGAAEHASVVRVPAVQNRSQQSQ